MIVVVSREGTYQRKRVCVHRDCLDSNWRLERSGGNILLVRLCGQVGLGEEKGGLFGDWRERGCQGMGEGLFTNSLFGGEGCRIPGEILSGKNGGWEA